MTISNGSVILAADLSALTTPSLALMASDAAQLPLGCHLVFTFPRITAAVVASNPERCRSSFVAPYDLLIETVGLQAGDLTAASTATATVTCPGPLDAFPVVVTGATGAGQTYLRSPLYDNSGKGTANTVRVIPAGATVTLDVATTSVAAASALVVDVVYRQFFARF